MPLDYRALYEEELQRRESTLSATNIPIGLLTVLGGLLATMLLGIPSMAPLLAWCFATAYGSAVYFFLRTSYYLGRSIHGYTYKLVPAADQLRAHQTALQVWHEDNGSAAEADSDFEQYLGDTYSAAASANRDVNLTKSEYLFRANRTILYCGLLTAVGAIPYVIAESRKPDPVTRIVIVADSSKHNGAIMGDTPKAPPPSPPPRPAPPPKPVGPPLQDFREGQIPKPRKP